MHHFRSLRAATAAAAAAMMAACAPAASRASSDALPAGFDVQTVEIRYHWLGLSVNSPVDALVRLERQGSGYTFTGTSEMALGRDDGRKKAGPLPITVPDSAMRAFLRELASAPRRPGEYEPIYNHTDDYPELTITLRSGAGVVEFFTSSQLDRPWRVTMGGQRYVSDSAVPDKAQRHLIPFDRHADLDRLLVEAGAQKP